MDGTTMDDQRWYRDERRVTKMRKFDLYRVTVPLLYHCSSTLNLLAPERSVKQIESIGTKR